MMLLYKTESVKPWCTTSTARLGDGFSTLRDLWTVLSGGNNTQHSCYGTGAAGCTQVEIPTERGYQGTGTGRPVFQTVLNGKTQNIAITIGDNGFIVGANPARTLK